MRSGHLFIFLFVMLAPVSGYATDYYVNGATGNDSVTCGPLDAPCKTVEQAVRNTVDGTNVIKIAAGTYTEHVMYISDAASLHADKLITLEGGWNSDFTANSGNRDATVLQTEKMDAGHPQLFDVSAGLSGHDGTVGLTLRNMTIVNETSWGIHQGINAFTNADGKIALTLENVRMTEFVDSILYVQSHSTQQMDITISKSLFDHNTHPDGNLLYIRAYSGRINLTITKTYWVYNGAPDVNNSELFIDSQETAEIDTRLENTIIAGNTSINGRVLYLHAVDTSRQNAKLVNITITDNTFFGIYGRGLDGYGDKARLTISMINSIVYGNHSPRTGDIFLTAYESATVTYTGNYNIVGTYDETGSPGNHRPTHTTYHETNVDPELNSSYHLTSPSPAVDAGICGVRPPHSLYVRYAPYDDIDGDKRPGYGKTIGCDIGADEYKFPWPMFLPAMIGNGL